MALPIINLVMLKRYTTDEPSVFDDTVHSVAFLLRQAGFETYLSCNTVDPGVLNIIWGAGTHFTPPLEQIRSIAKPEFSIIFNMEQLGSTSGLVNAEYLDFLSGYRVLDYNSNNILEFKKRYPQAAMTEFPVVPSPFLAGDYPRPSEGKQADVVFWGAANDRRTALLRRILERGHRVDAVAGAYGKYLSPAIYDARIVLNIHFYDMAVFEIARCLRPMASGIPIISERSRLPETVDWRESGIFFCDYDGIPDLCDHLLANPRKLDQAARDMRHFISRPDWVGLAKERLLALGG